MFAARSAIPTQSPRWSMVRTPTESSTFIPRTSQTCARKMLGRSCELRPQHLGIWASAQRACATAAWTIADDGLTHIPFIRLYGSPQSWPVKTSPVLIREFVFMDQAETSILQRPAMNQCQYCEITQQLEQVNAAPADSAYVVLVRDQSLKARTSASCASSQTG